MLIIATIKDSILDSLDKQYSVIFLSLSQKKDFVDLYFS